MRYSGPIVYLALAPDDRPIVTTCATLDAALIQIATDLSWDIQPIALDVDGRRYAIDDVLALLTPPLVTPLLERQVGG